MKAGHPLAAHRKREGLWRVRGSHAAAPALPVGSRPWWSAIVLAMLLALSWQSFVAQTHQHFSPAPVSTSGIIAAEIAAPALPGSTNPSDLPANCPVCREIAHAGSAVLPGPIVLEAPEPVVAWLAITPRLGVSLAQPSHAWRSRAPPTLLQA